MFITIKTPQLVADALDKKFSEHHETSLANACEKVKNGYETVSERSGDPGHRGSENRRSF